MSVRPTTKLHLALPFVCIAAVISATMAACVKYASSTLSADMLVFGRMLFSFICIVLWIEVSRPVSWKQKLHTKEWKVHCVRGLCGLISILLYYYSLKFLALADAMLLSSTMPIFVPIVVYFWRGIHLSHRIFWGIGIAFIGIILVLSPGGGVFHPAVIAALFSGIIGSIATVALRFAHFTEPGERTLFYYFLIGTIVSGIVTLFDVDRNWKVLNLDALGLLLIVGALGFAFQIFFTLATKFAPVRMISVFMYISVVIGILLDWWFWERFLTPFDFIGFTLVILGAFLSVYLYPKEIK